MLGTASFPEQCRSRPSDNIARLGQGLRPTSFKGSANLDSQNFRESYQHTHSAHSDRRPACSPSEYFSLETNGNNTVMDNLLSPAATEVDRYSRNNGTLPLLQSKSSCRNPVDETVESNSHASRTPRRSGIPVSGMT